jgi:hypothetical protein
VTQRQEERIERLTQQLAHKHEELTEAEFLCGRLMELLSLTARYLKGDPPPHGVHDVSDIPYLARHYKRSHDKHRGP